jgi:hypothetical protein
VEEYDVDYTPSQFKSNQTQKTGIGSGERMSLPGRQSLTSVAPYDDSPDKMVKKVEQVEKKVKKSGFDIIKSQNEKLMSSKRVVNNDGE